MNQDLGLGLAALVPGAILIGMVAWRLITGRSYMSEPALAVDRKTDPFAYWLSMIFPVLLGVPILLIGLTFTLRGVLEMVGS